LSDVIKKKKGFQLRKWYKILRNTIEEIIQVREWYKILIDAIKKIIWGPNLKAEKTKGELHWKKITTL
jgi:hypothetical protein